MATLSTIISDCFVTKWPDSERGTVTFRSRPWRRSGASPRRPLRSRRWRGSWSSCRSRCRCRSRASAGSWCRRNRHRRRTRRSGCSCSRRSWCRRGGSGRRRCSTATREYSDIINIFFVLVAVRVEVERGSIRHIAAGLAMAERTRLIEPHINADDEIGRSIAVQATINIGLSRASAMNTCNVSCSGAPGMQR